MNSMTAGYGQRARFGERTGLALGETSAAGEELAVQLRSADAEQVKRSSEEVMETLRTGGSGVIFEYLRTSSSVYAIWFAEIGETLQSHGNGLVAAGNSVAAVVVDHLRLVDVVKALIQAEEKRATLEMQHRENEDKIAEWGREKDKEVNQLKALADDLSRRADMSTQATEEQMKQIMPRIQEMEKMYLENKDKIGQISEMNKDFKQELTTTMQENIDRRETAMIKKFEQKLENIVKAAKKQEEENVSKFEKLRERMDKMERQNQGKEKSKKGSKAMLDMGNRLDEFHAEVTTMKEKIAELQKLVVKTEEKERKLQEIHREIKEKIQKQLEEITKNYCKRIDKTNEQIQELQEWQEKTKDALVQIEGMEDKTEKEATERWLRSLEDDQKNIEIKVLRTGKDLEQIVERVQKDERKVTQLGSEVTANAKKIEEVSQRIDNQVEAMHTKHKNAERELKAVTEEVILRRVENRLQEEIDKRISNGEARLKTAERNDLKCIKEIEPRFHGRGEAEYRKGSKQEQE